MATIKILGEKPREQNPMNIVADIEITTDDGEVIRLTDQAFAADLSVANLEAFVGEQVKFLQARQAARAELRAKINAGGVLNPKIPDDPPAPDAGLVQFQQRWFRLMKLKRLASVDAALVTMQTNIQGQVETYLIANPNAIDSVS